MLPGAGVSPTVSVSVTKTVNQGEKAYDTNSLSSRSFLSQLEICCLFIPNCLIFTSFHWSWVTL